MSAEQEIEEDVAQSERIATELPSRSFTTHDVELNRDHGPHMSGSVRPRRLVTNRVSHAPHRPWPWYWSRAGGRDSLLHSRRAEHRRVFNVHGGCCGCLDHDHRAEWHRRGARSSLASRKLVLPELDLRRLLIPPLHYRSRRASGHASTTTDRQPSTPTTTST